MTEEEKSRAVVYLDAMTFIFFIEGNPTVSKPVEALFATLREHPGVGVTSELTLAEVLAGSDKAQTPPVQRAYFDLIVCSSFLDLVPVSRDILCESATMRFVHRKAHGKKLNLPDAIHLVTATRASCRYFMSADKGIRPPVELRRVNPDIDGLAEIRAALA